MNQFCFGHIAAIFTAAAGCTPLDTILRGYFRAHKAIGARDRRIIAEAVYGMTRWKGLVDAHAENTALENRLAAYTELSCNNFLTKAQLPPHVLVSFPKGLYDRIYTAYGDETHPLCRVLNEQAPITLRANPLKISRESLIKRLAEYSPSPTPHAPHGLTFPKRENFFGMPEFKEGLFEMQDEGSQLLAGLIQAQPGDHVLDYCAGSGGKTLAFAHQLCGKGQVYLHDVREHALIEAKKRLKRAGIQNAQLVTRKTLKKPGMQKRMDWVLLDVPCSGTGTLRRNPDMKWRISEQTFEELVPLQREIFNAAYPLAKNHGYLVYATCSILPCENEEQVQYILENYPVALVKKPLKIRPTSGGSDGFFAAVFKKLEDES